MTGEGTRAHEAYLQLINGRESTVTEPGCTFGLSAQIMRRILVDFDREELCLNRGGGTLRVAPEGAGKKKR